MTKGTDSLVPPDALSATLPEVVKGGPALVGLKCEKSPLVASEHQEWRFEIQAGSVEIWGQVPGFLLLGVKPASCIKYTVLHLLLSI